MENRYEVTLDVLDKRITVNVFTKGKVTPAELKELSIQRGIEFMADFGVYVAKDQFKPIGYRDLGVFV